jgi:hypothetical protein
MACKHSKEIFKIRVDTLWKMLYLQRRGLLPAPYQEGATGRFDNKGAIFIPGGFILEDSDKRIIRDSKKTEQSEKDFIRSIRQAMSHDNATLVFPNSVVHGINLPNGFFIEKSAKILAIKDIVESPNIKRPTKYFSDNITMSLTPNYMLTPFGTRTKVSSCLSVCIKNPMLYYQECVDNYGIRVVESEDVWKKFRHSLKPVKSKSGQTLFLPQVTVMHDTRYTEQNLVGITRFLAVRQKYDYAILTFEQYSKDLVEELLLSNDHVSKDKIIASYNGVDVVPILRFYNNQKAISCFALSAAKDLNIDVSEVSREAKEVYKSKVLVKRSN